MKGSPKSPETIDVFVEMAAPDYDVGWRKYRGKVFYREHWTDSGECKVLKTWKRKRPPLLPPVCG